MSKFRITITATIEYEVNTAYYPDCETDEERLLIDIRNHEQHPWTAIEHADADFKVVGEIVT